MIGYRLREQARWCERLGSRLYADLLLRAARDAEAGGPVWEVLRGREEEPETFYAALRLLGSVHRVVLEGRAPALALHYPSAGGTPGDPWPAFRATVEGHAEELRRLIARPPQTNEVGRSASLLGGFLLVARDTGLPLRLLEVGASAGLNLRWDRYRYESGGWAWGDPGSPVRFEGVFRGPSAPPAVAAEVVERRGCDLDPIDPASQEGRLTLLSYVWPDQVERVERLRAALRVAEGVPAPVDRAPAVPWLEGLLAEPAPGRATVVFHSVVATYLEEEDRRRLAALLEEAGARATPEAPLAHLSLEREGDEFPVRLRRWPDGEERTVALSTAHGPPVEWRG